MIYAASCYAMRHTLITLDARRHVTLYAADAAMMMLLMSHHVIPPSYHYCRRHMIISSSCLPLCAARRALPRRASSDMPRAGGAGAPLREADAQMYRRAGMAGCAMLMPC